MLDALETRTRQFVALAKAGGPLVAAIACAGLLWVAGNAFSQLVVGEGQGLAAEELSAVAARAVAAAEEPVDAVTRAMNLLARGAPLSCVDATIAEFRRTLAALPAVANLGLVDMSGRLMCSAKGGNGADALLAPLSPRAPTVVLIPDPRTERGGLLIGWTPSSGPRLVAEMAADTPNLPALPAFAAGHTAITVGPTDGGVWRRIGADSFDMGENQRKVTAIGAAFPLVANVISASDFMPPAFAHIVVVAQRSIAALCALVLAAGLIFFWRNAGRRKAERIRGRSADAPTYRAVIEIDTGRLVGIDLALPPDEATIGVDIDQLCDVVADIAPVLRQWPKLKLSFPLSLALADKSADRDRLAESLAAAAIGPDQLVGAVDPGTAARRANAVGALVRRLRRLNIQIALAGPLDGMAALIKVKPDFVWLDDPIGGDDGKLRQRLLRMVADAAHEQKIGVLARGISDPSAIEALRACGITTATGPVFGTPLPAGAIAEIAKAAAAPEPAASEAAA